MKKKYYWNMEKPQIHKINRCTKTSYNHAKRKAPNPEKNTSYTNSSNICLRDSNGVEIIELDSSNESKILPDDDKKHRWSYAASYMKQDKDMLVKKPGEVCRDDLNENFVTDGFNHFKPNKNQYMESDSSSESDYFDADITDCNYVSDVNYFYNCNKSRAYKHDLDIAKQIIHIYSFSNERELSENDFTLINIDSHDTATTPTPEINFNRVATPIPRSHTTIKRNIALIPTLPNVTEVTEPNKTVLTPKEKKTQESTPKTVNTWIISNSNISKETQDKSIGVVSVFVSPRTMNNSFLKNQTEAQHVDVPPINISKLNPFSDEEIENIGSDSNTNRSCDHQKVKILPKFPRTKNGNIEKFDEDEDLLQKSGKTKIICENNLVEICNILEFKEKGAQTTDFVGNHRLERLKTVGTCAHKKISCDQICQTSSKYVKEKPSWFMRLFHCKCCK